MRHAFELLLEIFLMAWQAFVLMGIPLLIGAVVVWGVGGDLSSDPGITFVALIGAGLMLMNVARR